MKKYGTTIGDIHRNEIYDIIANEPNGIYQHEIIAVSGLTRQTVYTHLRKLMSKTRISRRNGQYFMIDYPGGITHFAMAMAKAGFLLAGLPKCNITYDSDGIMNRYLNRAVANFYQKFGRFTTSNKFCKTHFSLNQINEKQLFEFASKIGAFITYIFIEAMRPSERNTTVFNRNVRGRDFLNRAVNILGIFDMFQTMSIDLGMINKKFSNKESIWELNNNDFTKISNTFATVYPVIYKALEKYWLDEIDLEMEFSKRDCEHEWDHKHIYKLGNYYLCRKCDQLVNRLNQ